MKAQQDELAVIIKTYDFLLWTSKHVEKFPRSGRFTVGDRLQIQLQTVLEELLRAKYQRDKAQPLRSVNVELEVLRFQFRLAKDLRLLSIDSYGHASRSLIEIGQMVGGWLKFSEKRS
jgi:hypothetical protein